MRLASKYFWLQRWKSNREMTKSFYKQYDIQVNKKCLVPFFINTTETGTITGILGVLYSSPLPSMAQAWIHSAGLRGRR